MDQPDVHTAIAVCESFLARLSSLEDAMIDMADHTDPDPELDAADADPEYFGNNDMYRTTFAMVVAVSFDPRSWRHYTILLQYQQLLSNSVIREFWVLFEPTNARYQAAVGRWGSWEVVGARWPFKVPAKTKAGDVAHVCSGMWAALRVLASAALMEEARVGLCQFDVLAEGGVARRDVTRLPVEGVGTRLVAWAGRLWGVKMKQD